MRNVKLLLGAVILLLAVFLSGCTENGEHIPNEVQDTVESYFEAFKQSTAEAAKYAYFPTEDIREIYVEQTQQKLVSYKVKSIEKLNDELYAVTVVGRLNTYDSDEIAYGFVGNIDGTWLYIGTVDYIPETLSEGLDLSEYQYDDPNIV